MTKKIMLATVSALATLAYAALPAVSSAAPSIHFSEPSPLFSGSFSAGTLTAVGQEEILCTSGHDSGQWTTEVINGKNTGTTGTIQLTFTNCHTQSGITCTSSGQASGVVATAILPFHLIYITSDINSPGTMLTKVPGALVTLSGGVFVQFSCSFLANIKVAGTGLIGKLPSLACGANTGSMTVEFSSASTGKQTYQLVEGDATTYHLTSSLNGGTAVEASKDASGTATLANKATGELTCL